jgi:hypothetical protein
VHVHCLHTRKNTRTAVSHLTRGRGSGGARRGRRGTPATHSRSHQQHHARVLRPRHQAHLRGIFSQSEDYVEHQTLHLTKSRARTSPSHHQHPKRQESQNVPAAHFRLLPLASLARTAAIRTSAVAEQGTRTPDLDLPRFRPRVQTRLRKGHRCSDQKGAV